MQLIAKLYRSILAETLAKDAMLVAHSADIARFEDLCAVLRQQGSSFEMSANVSTTGIEYGICPADHGDYLEIIEALAGMGARRTLVETFGPMCRDLVDMQPDAPAFFLSIPLTN